MLRQLIGQLQELSPSLYGSQPPNTPPLNLPPFYLLRHNDEEEEDQQHRWCFPSTDEVSMDDCCDYVMEEEKESGSLKRFEPSYPTPSRTSRKQQNRGETNGNDTMDVKIWQEFPEELFEAIISRLPVATFFQFRLVCRDWNSLVYSKSFSQHCADLPSSKPWFYTITQKNTYSGTMYDPSSKKWRHLPISSLHKKSILLPVASAGGLVCFLDMNGKNFYVSNPLTQSFRYLPAHSVKAWPRIAVGMTLNGKSTSDGYRILWLDREGEYGVYDSLRDAWIKQGKLSLSVKLPALFRFKSQPVSVHKTVFFLEPDLQGVLSYDMASDIWKQNAVPAPPNLGDCTLAECDGKLRLVGLVRKNAATSVCIWELQKMTQLWKEVDRMPNIWSLAYYGKQVSMNCVGNKGRLIMLTLRSGQKSRIVTYDFVTKEWVKVPGLKVLWVACGVAFHPCPTATATASVTA